MSVSWAEQLLHSDYHRECLRFRGIVITCHYVQNVIILELVWVCRIFFDIFICVPLFSNWKSICPQKRWTNYHFAFKCEIDGMISDIAMSWKCYNSQSLHLPAERWNLKSYTLITHLPNFFSRSTCHIATMYVA